MAFCIKAAAIAALNLFIASHSHVLIGHVGYTGAVDQNFFALESIKCVYLLRDV